MKKFAAYLKRRAFEPSTYLGLAGLVPAIAGMAPGPMRWIALLLAFVGIAVSDNAIKQWADTPPQ